MAPPSMLDEVSVSEPFPACSDAVIDLVDLKERSDDPEVEGEDRQEVIDVAEEEISDETMKKAPSNEYVLVIAFVSFLLFVIVQVAFAMKANSRSMLADCAAMTVDAATYLFNFFAERYKRKLRERGCQQQEETNVLCNNCLEEEPILDDPPARQERQAGTHDHQGDDEGPQNLYLELIPPAISVVALTVVTSFSIRTAAVTFHPAPGQPLTRPVNLTIMLAFSSANLLLDVVNVFCFSRIKRNIFGLENLNVCSAWTVRFWHPLACGPARRHHCRSQNIPYISISCFIDSESHQSSMSWLTR